MDSVKKLRDVKTLQDLAWIHYEELEAAIPHASVQEVQEYYGYVHGGIPLEDVINDKRFPWHPEYKQGDSKKCCLECVELEMALMINVIDKPDSPFASWYRDLIEQMAEARAREQAEAYRKPLTVDFDTWLGQIKDEAKLIVFTEEEASLHIRTKWKWYRRQYELNMTAQETALVATGH
ncbi:hypothetical protein ACTOWA_00070 [Herbaspirillum seropedicae]|uniref:hypothetical protein n=1 Tax=Herbaspirillum seropedicae TaxID=964 RepID=UPI002865937C|nr:hypothetical protein [Herbaspirillum seropedicae]MDR6398017.1 hypothetical protein [Herbaspirillum seropedicae]